MNTPTTPTNVTITYIVVTAVPRDRAAYKLATEQARVEVTRAINAWNYR